MPGLMIDFPGPSKLKWAANMKVSPLDVRRHPDQACNEATDKIVGALLSSDLRYQVVVRTRHDIEPIFSICRTDQLTVVAKERSSGNATKYRSPGICQELSGQISRSWAAARQTAFLNNWVTRPQCLKVRSHTLPQGQGV
jgi:hypothetical protein